LYYNNNTTTKGNEMAKIRRRTKEELAATEERPVTKVDWEPFLKEVSERTKKALRILKNR
jgi:hypothetical protein